MSRKPAIEAEGRIVEPLSSFRYRVELANGHRLVARMSGKLRLNFVKLNIGDNVLLEMSPYDLSSGCILSRKSL